MITIPSASADAGFFKSSELSRHYDPAAIGLAFSGGGYRATLFHAGALLRMNEMGILAQATRISGVSGGAIATGILAANWDNIDWSTGVASHDDMTKHFIEPCLKITSKSIDVINSIAGYLPGVSAGNQLARSYDRHVFGGRMLSSITDSTRFIFGALNLQTGGLVRFSRNYVADWRAFRSTTRNIKLSEAVAASSAFPPVLAPLRLRLHDEDVTLPDGARFDDPALRQSPVLVDGGIADIIGLEPVWKRCGIIIASNAGQNNPARTRRFVLGMLLQVLLSSLDAGIDMRERTLISLYRNLLADGLPERRGAYWTIATNTDRLEWSGYKATQAQLLIARNMATRLTRIPPMAQRAVILSGYSYADATIRSFLLPNAPAPTTAPTLPV